MFVCLSVRPSVVRRRPSSSGLIISVLDIWPGFGRQALRNWVFSVSSEQFEIRFLADSGIGFVYKLIKKKHQIRTFLIKLDRFWTEFGGLRNRIRVQTDPKVAPNLMKFYTMCPSGHPCPAVCAPVVKSHHYKVLNRPENQGYGCYGAPRVSYAPRKYAESTGNPILRTSYTADFLPTHSGLGDRSIWKFQLHITRDSRVSIFLLVLLVIVHILGFQSDFRNSPAFKK